MTVCKVCGHAKDEHKGHIAPDHTGQKINHISCRVIIKREEVDFMGGFGVSSIGHTCSCHGVKPNTSLKNAIKKYEKHLKTLDPNLVKNQYARKELKAIIKRFKQNIKDNPKNLLHWQLEEQNEDISN